MRLRFRFRSWRQMLRLRIRFSAQRAGCHPITKGLNRHHWSKATTSTEGRDVKGQDEVPPLEQQLLRYQCDGRSKRSKGNRMAQVTTKGIEKDLSDPMLPARHPDVFYAWSARARAQGLSAGQKVETPLHDMTWSKHEGNQLKLKSDCRINPKSSWTMLHGMRA